MLDESPVLYLGMEKGSICADAGAKFLYLFGIGAWAKESPLLGQGVPNLDEASAEAPSASLGLVLTD